MTSPQQLEILDLRHFPAQKLRPLLEQQADVWNRRLHWNYKPSTELLLQYLDSRILPGFVALERSRIVGFCFCVYEGHKAVIGDIYSSRYETDPLAIVHTLTRHLLETLEASPDIRRIETQLLLFDSGILPPLFASALSQNLRFQVFPRLFLELPLGPRAVPLPPPPPFPPAPFPPDIELCRWSPTFYNPTAELIQHAYLNHPDADINDQYRTLAGSQRFLHNIIRFPGCGTFDPDSSCVLRTRRDNTLVAVLLVSRVAPDAAHITQLCVAPTQRGRRLGASLLRHVLRQLPQRAYSLVTLTVSENNPGALALYTAAGFRPRHRFDALVLDKPTTRPIPWPPFPRT
jgi:ribosomal protein S18 acetylase RimI-like enzyme